MAAKPKNGPTCVVTIGFQNLLMPMAEGMKVVALLASAVEVEHDYESARRSGYIVGEPVQVRFETVTAAQIRVRRDTQDSTARGILHLEGPQR
ncbi:hypothetical protein JWH04_20510 [Xanthomonas melonis]|uniref:hypothetical protein n=1 Tax=Xanthomonas melonis TaxID=56456 RepID=UPI001E2A0475|nr:hypothetical protein [Xanthomonas melonis]MCD0281292.1 hypothetical protein [Xanthomonas melonis]